MLKIKFKTDYSQTGNKKGDVIEVKGNKKSFAASNLAAVADLVSDTEDDETGEGGTATGGDKGKGGKK